MDVIAFVPSLMLSLTFATCIDYGLFMLSRFCEDMRKGLTQFEAIVAMLDSAGHTITMSGATLMVCFLGLLFFSMEMLQSVGVGAAVTLLSVLAVNLTLTPALLFVAGPTLMMIHEYINLEKVPFLGSAAQNSDGNACCGRGGDESGASSFNSTNAPASMSQSSATPSVAATPGNRAPPIVSGSRRSSSTGSPVPHNEPEETTVLLGLESQILDAADRFDDTLDDRPKDNEFDEDGEYLPRVKQSFWYKLGALLLTKWKGLLACLVLLALMVPVDMYCLSVEPDISFLSMIPTGCSSYEAYEGISEYFGDGFATPYRIIFENVDDRVTIYSDEGFTRMQGAITTMINNLPYTTMGGYFGANILKYM